MNHIRELVQQIKIYDCLEFTKIRIGNKNDGGYIALREICEKTKNVYSFGIGDDVGFELDFAKQWSQARFNLFDPTIKKLPVEHPRFKFLKCGTFNPDESMAKDALLKMDVEYNEWDMISNVTDNQLLCFSQILIEVHIVHAEPRANLTEYFHGFYQGVLNQINNNLFKKYSNILKRLCKYFYIFHAHANNSLKTITADSYKIPPLLELSLVRKDLVSTVTETQCKFPVDGLDFPNKTDRGDILNWWPIC
jgi:hypothetical protein